MWLGLHLIDVLLTFYLFGLGGAEANPMLAFVEGHAGASLMLTAKLILALAAGLVLMQKGKSALLGVGNRLMGVVVAYNLALAAYVTAVAGSSGLAR